MTLDKVQSDQLQLNISMAPAFEAFLRQSQAAKDQTQRNKGAYTLPLLQRSETGNVANATMSIVNSDEESPSTVGSECRDLINNLQRVRRLPLEQYRSVSMHGDRYCLKLTKREGCDSSCRCFCHDQRRWSSPTPLHVLLGSLIINYRSSPSLVHSCDKKCGKRAAKPETRIQYTFPKWLLDRVLSIAISDSAIGPELIIRCPRIQPSDSLIFQAIWKGDATSLRNCLISGRASVLDADEYGKSAFHWSIYWFKKDYAIDTLNRKEVIEVLLRLGANPFQEDPYRR